MNKLAKIIVAGTIVTAPSLAFAQDVEWSGPYAGITTGNVTGNSAHCNGNAYSCDAPDTSGTPTSPEGSAVSGFVGYNHSLSGSIIVGGELSFMESDASGSGTGPMGCGAAPCETEIRSATTIALRAGKPVGKVLPFVSVGYTDTVYFGSIDGTSSSEVSGSSISYGVGVDVALGNNWMVRGEFQMVNDPGVLTYDVNAACGSPACALTENEYSVVKIGVGYRF